MSPDEELVTLVMFSAIASLCKLVQHLHRTGASLVMFSEVLDLHLKYVCTGHHSLTPLKCVSTRLIFVDLCSQ